MDWTKAKTILIVVFLFTNLFLGYELLKLSAGGNNYIDNAQINDTLSYFKRNNIDVTAVVPNRAKPMPTLLVRYRAFTKTDAAGVFFGSARDFLTEETEEGINLIKGDISIQLQKNNELYYSNKSVKPSASLDENKCRNAALAFIKKIGIKGSRFQKSKAAAGGYYKFTYGQNYKGEPIYNSYIEITTNGEDIREARVVWFDSIKELTKATNVISSVEALLKAYQELTQSPKSAVISGMEQGYYYNITGTTPNAVEGTVFPVWRVKTNKSVFYINAYDEKLEKMD